MRRIGAAIAVSSLGFVLLGAAGLTAENYERVKNGMTLDEVKALLGAPSSSGLTATPTGW